MRYNRARYFSNNNNNKHKKRKKGQKFKSNLEQKFAELLLKKGLKAEYEPETFRYQRIAHYTPDWRIRPGVFIETKGYFSPANRGHLLSFREQHPGITICLAFQSASNRLNARSKTTYGEWATKNGFKWCDLQKGFPSEWFII
jgi:hypothetical protein